MTDTFQAATRADAQFVHDEWDRRTRARDIDGLLDLYLADATLESPLVPRVLDQPSGVLRGHEELRRFFVLGTAGRPDNLVRWYRTGEYMFNGHTLIWEYPRQAPEWEQVDLVEVMELTGPRIARHRIYWGCYGTPLLQRAAAASRGVDRLPGPLAAAPDVRLGGPDSHERQQARSA
jgi:hypothetical protein